MSQESNDSPNIWTAYILPMRVLKSSHSNQIQEVEQTNTKSISQMLDPRFNQLLKRYQSKVLPHTNDIEQQTDNKNVQTNETNQYHQLIKCLTVLAVILCLIIILVPTILILTLPTKTTLTSTLPLVVITHSGDLIRGIYNTTAGCDMGGLDGIYSSSHELPEMALDGNTSTKYLNFGTSGSGGAVLLQPGINTGFYITPTISNTTTVCSFIFATGNDDPQRDPITITLEGTNATSNSTLILGSSWTLIYSGSTGIYIDKDPGREKYGIQQYFSNTKVFSSYRLLVTWQRNSSNSVQYSEVQLFGYIY